MYARCTPYTQLIHVTGRMACRIGARWFWLVHGGVLRCARPRAAAAQTPEARPPRRRRWPEARIHLGYTRRGAWRAQLSTQRSRASVSCCRVSRTASRPGEGVSCFDFRHSSQPSQHLFFLYTRTPYAHVLYVPFEQTYGTNTPSNTPCTLKACETRKFCVRVPDRPVRRSYPSTACL